MGGINGGIPSLYNHFQILAEYILNLEKGYRWTYLQGRNRDADVEKGHVDTVGARAKDGEGGMNGESSNDIYTQPCVNA